ncbi:hypothetical protein A5791_00770 [Mycobacterium sp. 852002-51163_SCH5372311]|uniref:hypothetical protein n=1 Tax=Mycobacterium sp. 852002-51163_SCH5372311 TaxID=1834097 RepID=UPI00080053A5|nr:hypothetical protein [Mycobacterium sp. 852002-51163_SCH5372311]OBF91572.1 hypothetical protein A5791_00770 [Mycobacterium sp. 852002-51163_SCH5372311]
MAHFSGSSPESQIILLGDHDTVVGHRTDLSEYAAHQGCAIAEAFSFAPGEPASHDDLTEVEAVVSALGRAIARRMHIWVPFPGPDFGREQHWRRLSLVLQRHGLTFLFGREIEPCPSSGGFSEIDYALRREVQAVDELDNAALAVAGTESLSREIELALVTSSTAAPVGSAVRRLAAGGGTDAAPRTETVSPPTLPAPTAAWAHRQPVLKRYVRWLVHECGVTQVATARVLNSAGQRTPKGRLWQSSSVSALLNGRYDRGGESCR